MVAVLNAAVRSTATQIDRCGDCPLIEACCDITCQL